MSQKSNPRSPKSPRSKSPSSENVEGAEGQGSQSRRIVSGDLQAPLSRIPSPRTTFAYEEELSSLPSPITYGERTAGTSSAGVAISSAGRVGPLSGTSGCVINEGVDAGVSPKGYRMPNQQPSSYMGSSCMADSRFLNDIEEVPHETSQYILLSVNGSGRTGRDFGRGSGGIQNQALPCRGTAPAESEHHVYNLTRAPSHNVDHALSPPRRDMNARTIGMAEHAHHHHHHHHGRQEELPERDERMVSALGHLSQLKKTSSYLLCGLNQGTDFLKQCCPKVTESSVRNKPAKFPEIPCLRQEEIGDLIKCEAQDVESVSYLTSDERKSYKKPCPKQQKAQMTVKSLMQAHTRQSTCQNREYSPLEHPDPEDISPEVAAAMMFSQERGIKMDECPNDIITDLFPDEKKAPFPEKIPQSNISVVDRNSKDQEEMMEKSATVPSDGVSDSAYTRTMKEKGEDVGPQRSFDVDFAIGQSKREYVLVAQKPQRINKVQYRGNSPSWFPGYLSAFPDDENLKVVSSPSGLFHRAWAHSNPENIPTSDVIVLD